MVWKLCKFTHLRLKHVKKAKNTKNTDSIAFFTYLWSYKKEKEAEVVTSSLFFAFD